MKDNLCSFELPSRPITVQRLFGPNEEDISSVKLEEHLKIYDDDTIDDVIGKVSCFYQLNPLSFCIFSLKETLIYGVKDFPFDVNPFIAASEYSGITTEIKEDYNLLHTKCLIEFEIPENELYVVNVNDLLDYVRQEEKDVEKFSKDILPWYFKHNYLEIDDYKLYEEKSKARYKLKNLSVSNELNFRNCVLLEAQVLINENETKPFVDLQKVFNFIALDKELPFAYQRGNTANEMRVKVLNGITHLIDDESVLVGWLNTVKSDIDTKSNKSLILKLKNYDDNYSTVTIFRNGKIELRCQWEEERNANKEDLIREVQRVVQIVQHINKHKYNLPKLSDDMSSRKIGIPDINSMITSFETGIVTGNTRVSLCNISSSFTAKNINFELLNDYINTNFYNIADVIYKNTMQSVDSIGIPTTYYNKPSSVYLRYKQYSDYGHPKVAMTFLNNVVENTVGLKNNAALRDKLASIISKKFMMQSETAKSIVHNVVENFAYSFDPKLTLEYAANKAVKNPGIEIRISKSQNVLGEFKYMFIGNISLFYASKISSFIKSVISSYISAYDGSVVQREENENLNDDNSLEIDDILDEDEINDILDDYGDYLDEENLFEDESGSSPSNAVPGMPSSFVAKPSSASSSMKGKTKMTIIDRLRDIDNDLYGKAAKYGTACQKPFQPAVMSVDEVKEIRENISRKINSIDAALQVDPNEPQLNINKKHLEYNKKAFESGVNFMDMYYACPSVWCPTCNDFIPFYEIQNSKICPVCKQEIHFRENYDETTGIPNNDYYPGFRTNGLGKMVPCCRIKRYAGWNDVEDGLIKDDEYFENRSNVEAKDQDENYILNKNKLFLAENRMAHLPDTISILFEGKNKNCLKNGSEIIRFLTDDKINCYLRMGVRNDRHSFLNAIRLITPFRTVDKMLETLFENLSVELFVTLKNGSLRYIFKDEKEDTDQKALENFKKYIEDINNVVDERLMWELFSSSGIVIKPINIIIISMTVDDKKLSNPSWLCPLGYDTSKLFKLDRKSLVLIKYDNNYEILVKNSYKNGLRIKDPLFKENDALANYFINVLDRNCTMESVYKDTIMSPGNGPMTAQEIVSEINTLKQENSGYFLDGQILDGYNRIEYLVTRNNLKIPVNLYSGPLFGIPVVSYGSIAPLDYDTTIAYAKTLSSLTNIPILPKSNVIDNDGSIMGIIVQSSNFIETLPHAANNELVSITYVPSINADNALKEQNNGIDKRVQYIRQKEFEDETYERLRYEFSKYLALNNEFMEMFVEMLNKGDLSTIYNVVLKIFDKLVVIVDNISLTNYSVPHIRKACFSTNEEIKDDIHCYFEDGKNKVVVVGSNNYVKMVFKFANELYNNTIKRDEILEDNVNDVASGIMGSVRDNERVYENLQVSKIQKIIKELYLSDNPVENALEGLYDVKNPVVSSKYIRKPFVYNFDNKEAPKLKLRVPGKKEIVQTIENITSEDLVEEKPKKEEKEQKRRISFKPKTSAIVIDEENVMPPPLQEIENEAGPSSELTNPKEKIKKLTFTPKTVLKEDKTRKIITEKVEEVKEVEEAEKVEEVKEVKEAEKEEEVKEAQKDEKAEEVEQVKEAEEVEVEEEKMPSPLAPPVQAKIVSPPEPTLTLQQQQETVSIISPKPSEPSIEKVQKAPETPVEIQKPPSPILRKTIVRVAPAPVVAPAVPSPVVPSPVVAPIAPAVVPAIVATNKRKIKFKTKSDVLPAKPQETSLTNRKITFKVKTTDKMPSPF